MGDVEEEERPLWFPEDQIPQESIDSSAAIAEGLRLRSCYDTALLRPLAGTGDGGPY